MFGDLRGALSRFVFHRYGAQAQRERDGRGVGTVMSDAIIVNGGGIEATSSWLRGGGRRGMRRSISFVFVFFFFFLRDGVGTLGWI